MARTVINNALVLTAGTRYDQEEAKAGKPQRSTVVTLAVLPEDGERIALATIHEKDRAIGPAFRRMLGAHIVTAPAINTDTLGTFSGEIPRPAPLVETCLQKAEMAFGSLDVDCAIASEGSYGPIDRVPLAPGGFEIMA